MLPRRPITPSTGKQSKKTQTAADLSVVPLQEKLKDLNSDLEKLKDDDRIMQRQLQEAHKQVLEEGRHLQTVQAALRQRDAEVAQLRAELRGWVSTPVLAPAPAFMKLIGLLKLRLTDGCRRIERAPKRSWVLWLGCIGE